MLPASTPWQPLFTIERSGKPEVTVYGMVSVVAGMPLAPGAARNFETLIATENTGFEVWSRSTLKPWQLLSHFNILKEAYPALRDEHLALFMASHSAEPLHIDLLKEACLICQVSEENLKCPPAKPVKEEVEKSLRRYHNCSGKHIGYLAALKAQGASLSDYLKESEAHHTRLKHILSVLTGRIDFDYTTDGCQLPNYALSIEELASLYNTLVREELPSQEPIFSNYRELGRLMHKCPRIISGAGRLDLRIMNGELLGERDFYMLAKEGADGLLSAAVSPNANYPYGLGICIKLSSGFDNRHMEIIFKEILRQTGLYEPKVKIAKDDVRTDHIKTRFHFHI